MIRETLLRLVCKIRLCTPTEVVHDGLAQIGMNKQNKPGQYTLTSVLKCTDCNRKVYVPWTKERRELWRKTH